MLKKKKKKVSIMQIYSTPITALHIILWSYRVLTYVHDLLKFCWLCVSQVVRCSNKNYKQYRITYANRTAITPLQCQYLIGSTCTTQWSCVDCVTVVLTATTKWRWWLRPLYIQTDWWCGSLRPFTSHPVSSMSSSSLSMCRAARWSSALGPMTGTRYLRFSL